MSIFDKGSETYRSDLVLGEQYREKSTGVEGKAVCIAFFEHACERVTLRYLHDGDVKEASFDAPEVERVKTGRTPVQQATGGPARNDGRRGVISR
jgi:hypothetical protein